MAKQIDYPADTVDANGKVWETVGENIRNGAKGKNITTAIIDELLNDLYPVGYVFIGVLPEFLKNKFVWEPGLITPYGSRACVLLTTSPVGAGITHLPDKTVPVLSNDDLDKFNASTGLSIPRGAAGIPVCHRVA